MERVLAVSPFAATVRLYLVAYQDGDQDYETTVRAYDAKDAAYQAAICIAPENAKGLPIFVIGVDPAPMHAPGLAPGVLADGRRRLRKEQTR